MAYRCYLILCSCPLHRSVFVLPGAVSGALARVLRSLRKAGIGLRDVDSAGFSTHWEATNKSLF